MGAVFYWAGAHTSIKFCRNAVKFDWGSALIEPCPKVPIDLLAHSESIMEHRPEVRFSSPSFPGTHGRYRCLCNSAHSVFVVVVVCIQPWSVDIYLNGFHHVHCAREIYKQNPFSDKNTVLQRKGDKQACQRGEGKAF